MHKNNIVSSQAVLEMSSFSMDTRSMSSSPLVNSLAKNRLFKTAPDIDEPPFQFIHTTDLSVVDKIIVIITKYIYMAQDREKLQIRCMTAQIS